MSGLRRLVEAANAQRSGTYVRVKSRDYDLVNDGPQTVDATGVTATDVALQANINAAAAIVKGTRVDPVDGTTSINIAQTVTVPDGVYKLNNPLVWPVGVNLKFAPGARLKAAASMAAVLDTNIAVKHVDEFIEGGIFDCNGLALIGVNLRLFAHMSLRDIIIYNTALHGMILGDSSASTTSYEAMVNNLKVWNPKTSAVPAGGYGLWTRYAADSEFVTGIIVGSETGVRTERGGCKFSHYHPWGFQGLEPTTSFDDNATGTVWNACSADSPTTYGWHLRQSGVRIMAGHAYRNANMADNLATAVYVEGTAPTHFISGLRVFGETSANRWAKDLDGPGLGGATWVGLEASNVATISTPNHFAQTPNKAAVTIRTANSGTGDLLDLLSFGGTFKGPRLKDSGEIAFSTGGTARTIVTKTSSYTLTASDDIVIANGSGITLTLPAAGTPTVIGRMYTLRNIGSSSVTVGATSGNVDGAASVTLAVGAAARYFTDGTGWWSC